MASLDTVSLTILLGSVLILAGILSSLIAFRFGAPLLLVFLLVGMLAGEGGPGGLKFDDIATTYTVGSIALALILFDGGLRTRFATFRSVLAPSVALATCRRADHDAADRAGRQIRARHRLDPGAAGRRGGGFDRRSGGVSPHQCRRPAAAPARARHAGSGIGQQRPVRGVPGLAAGRNPAQRKPELGPCAADFRPRRRARRRHRRRRRAGHYPGTEPADAGARAARAVRGGKRAGGVRLRQRAAFVGIFRGLSRRPGGGQPADPRP